MKCLYCFTLVIYLYFAKVDAEQDGCQENIRLFGPNNQYKCNCKDLYYCNFANNGNCQNAECKPYFGGPFCQKRLYHQQLKDQTSVDSNIFKNIQTKVESDFSINLTNVERVNQIRIACYYKGRNFSIDIGKTQFCEMSCTQTAKCIGDTGNITEKTLSIKLQGEIQVSNLEITGCSPFWFGENCDKQCHCANNSDCHQITGNCPLGCENGRSGTDCQKLNYENVALNRRTYQISTLKKDIILANGICKEQQFSFAAKLAVDGNIDQKQERGSCMRTTEDRSPYWQVYLDKTYSISNIRIYNTDSMDSDDLIGFKVYVGSKLCRTLSENIVKASKIIDISCTKVLQGNLVQIKSSLREYKTLHICEVEVLQCLHGFYGYRCSNKCHQCKYSSCEQQYGRCLSGCAYGYKQHPNKTCTAGETTEDLDSIWDEQFSISPEIADGCNENMRLFGPNDIYQCHCKELSSCEFKNNGKCKEDKCISHYGGPFCQQILYHKYLAKRIPKEQNVFINKIQRIYSQLNITFKYKYRINLIKMNCSLYGSQAKVSLYIGSTMFCEGMCHEMKSCRGDAIGKYLVITTTRQISLSNVKVSGCSRYWFGRKCDKQCHCAQNKECHMLTGNCTSGCENGRSGPDCQTLNYENVALNRRTYQNSILYEDIILANGICREQQFSFAAKLAVDGNIDQKQERGSCMRTTEDRSPYWKVYLDKIYSISNIRIYNTDSMDSDDLIGFDVYVGSKLCRTLSEDIVKASKIIDISCTKVLQGNFVKIKTSLRDYKALHICEVEVLQCLPGFYGYRCNNSCHQCNNSSCEQHSGRCHSGCAPGYKEHSNKTCTAGETTEDLDSIWDDGPRVSPNTTGCPKDMRLFGPNDIYQCHCKELSSCDFKNNGKCKEDKCISHYGGPFCQQILYHKYLEKRVSEEQNVFTNKKQWIYPQLKITFKYKYRINLIKIDSIGSGGIVLNIGTKKFCDLMYPNMTQCKGDAIGKYLVINPTHQFSLSNMKVSGCSPFWFGEKCDKQCHCANNDDCHQITGNCPHGCESGRGGTDCQKLNYENVAVNKIASQSSTYNRSIFLQNNTCKEMPFNFTANLAVDGNIDQQHERLSCMHTNDQDKPEWKVDLGEKYNISWIRIYNRNNKNMWRLNSASISVDEELCYSINIATEIVDINCKKVIHGRTVTISKKSKNILHFCEVEVLQCIAGFYGDTCSKNCPECRDLSCDQWSGKCRSGCAPGYRKYGYNCTACDDGTFGEECTKKCRCKNNYNCDKGNGNCGSVGCELGYKGDTCQKPCDYGTFGGGCSGTCHCKNNNNCNRRDGTCGLDGCEPGYLGDNCQQSCDDGTFGEGCSMACHCKNNNNCDKGNGNCGSVGCELGYKGDNCQEPCSVDTFGDRCSETCHCKNNTNCDRKTGTCGAEGCATGYKGSDCQEFNFIIPLIIILSIVIIIAAGITIAFYFKLRKSKRKKNTSMTLPKVSLQDNIEMDSVVENNEEEDLGPMEDQENIYMNSESLQQELMGITKNNILSYVQNKKMEELPFAGEFLKLPKGLLYAHDIAKEEKNKSKNRYKTILPYDHSRVCLQPDGHSSSDYINGNYLTVNKTYIATQGPLNSTIPDFWRMVYQTQCSIIVMLTNLSENGKVKSEQYWPDLDMTKTYGLISVSNNQENKYSYYTYRQFCITKNSMKFWVDHYQFTIWPDHGAPKDSEYFIAFRNKVRSTPIYKTPIIVHCSAGVGRSGTYIVLDIILEEMENSSRIDVMGCILALRKYRTLIVQNRSQLEYIYDVLAENIFTGSTVIYVNDLPNVYVQLQKFPDPSSASFMELQFEEFILPVNSTRNNSSHGEGASSSYDNGQYETDDENDIHDITILNGNNSEEEFMLISTPSEENFAEFWRVIFLKRCSLLVMFDNMEGAAYWPEKKNFVANYKHFAVTLVEEVDNDYYIERTLKVSSSELNIPDLVVHQFQLNIWLGTDFPSPKIMADIIQAVHNSQISRKYKNIALHCLDGISKNSLFCVLYMIIEILQKDSSISIVQLIRLLKRKKEDIMTDYMSYHYCWLVAKTFVEELSEYGNITY